MKLWVFQIYVSLPRYPGYSIVYIYIYTHTHIYIYIIDIQYIVWLSCLQLLRKFPGNQPLEMVCAVSPAKINPSGRSQILVRDFCWQIFLDLTWRSTKMSISGYLRHIPRDNGAPVGVLIHGFARYKSCSLDGFFKRGFPHLPGEGC